MGSVRRWRHRAVQRGHRIDPQSAPAAALTSRLASILRTRSWGEAYGTAEERRRYHLTERAYGHFERTIPLPHGVDAEKAEVSYRDGVLTAILPKTDTLPPRRLTIGETQRTSWSNRSFRPSGSTIRMSTGKDIGWRCYTDEQASEKSGGRSPSRSTGGQANKGVQECKRASRLDGSTSSFLSCWE